MDKSIYKNVFVFIEQRDGNLQSVGLELLGKARDLAKELSEEVYAVLMGYNIEDKATELIEYGADKVIIMDSIELKEYSTEAYTQGLCKLIQERNPSIVLIGATTIGRDLGPRISARITTGLTADCTRLEISEDKELLMTRPAFGGNLMATIICPDHRPQMSTVRPGVMRSLPRDRSRKGEIEKFEISFNKDKFRVRIKETIKEKTNMIDITEAKILVSGGRGIGNKEGFENLNQLAQTLGAEVSASRAIVDSGLIDHNRQVGQTGKTVRPDLYIACGISGAIQHIAGMEESEFILAINKDRYAPIMQMADLGIVGDAKDIIPALNERLKSLKNKD
ncbi:MAG: electron transfer flavoprotein subunit alpha/FixB family protein [Bacteroidales bacterium]|jgi:electron transfer flavoprotein alpha subunit|nr:electron transfer flavoprotein subunit alpha/FixB family protein [Bacteroidales bacterium]MDD4544601.1 electron transfer flavoprotein subunit alpha/FixB family protein [Bacteroidales bacterium]MDY0053417.1 electron transfer flavoprotein subunit alpha/FixB family protein [Bacteroidales bacterium]